MTLIELLRKSEMAYVTIHPTFPGPIVTLMISVLPKLQKFTVWEDGKFADREKFSTEEEAVAHIQKLMSHDQ